MGEIKSFLESSTIHGLAYLTNPKKYLRLFWTLVVIAGFTGAGVLIYKSFQSWDEEWRFSILPGKLSLISSENKCNLSQLHAPAPCMQ